MLSSCGAAGAVVFVRTSLTAAGNPQQACGTPAGEKLSREFAHRRESVAVERAAGEAARSVRRSQAGAPAIPVGVQDAEREPKILDPRSSARRRQSAALTKSVTLDLSGGLQDQDTARGTLSDRPTRRLPDATRRWGIRCRPRPREGSGLRQSCRGRRRASRGSAAALRQ
jgi:hypothetical protein